jgi:hypothetical protein
VTRLRAIVPLAAAAAILVSSAGGAGQPLVQVNVSLAEGLQAEVAVAIDPDDHEVLLAASNSGPGGARVYSSVDGGARWRSEPSPIPPLRSRFRCPLGDPAVSVGPQGSRDFVFLYADCDQLRKDFEVRRLPDVSVAHARRAGRSATWAVHAVARHGKRRFDDKPALAVDVSPASPHWGRIYISWTLYRSARDDGRIVLTHSDDGGLTWSALVRVDDDADAAPTFSSIALAADGTVYVAWTNAGRRILVDRSADGTRFGPDVLVDVAAGHPSGDCGPGGASIPAQPRRCVTPAPLVSVDRTPGPFSGRVYVTYSAAGDDGRQQDVFVAAFDLALTPLLGSAAGARLPINPADGAIAASDQFLPVSAVDQTTGDIWTCFYDTTGDRRRIKSWFSCSASADGGATWMRPVRAASVSSNETVWRASDFGFGDYEGLAVANGVAHPMWTDSRDLKALGEEIYTTVLTRASLQLP